MTLKRAEAARYIAEIFAEVGQEQVKEWKTEYQRGDGCFVYDHINGMIDTKTGKDYTGQYGQTRAILDELWWEG